MRMIFVVFFFFVGDFGFGFFSADDKLLVGLRFGLFFFFFFLFIYFYVSFFIFFILLKLK